MKKQIIILTALALFTSPWALAQSSEITVTTLPPVQQTSSVVDIDISGVASNTAQSAIQLAVNKVVAEAHIIRTYQFIQHVDLRDITKYDKQLEKQLPDSADRLPGTSKKILDAVLVNTERFIGDPNIKYYEGGARGPSEKSSSLSIAERKKNPFVIGKRYPHTYTDTLFSVDYISAKETSPSVIEADLLLFAHSKQKGPFFKKITVVVDWNKNRTQRIEDVVRVTHSSSDILLSDTDFSLKGSIADQKIILEDKNYGLTKVFPVTVGAIDARDNVVASMNFHVPESNRRAAKNAGLNPKLQEEFQDFSNAALVNRRVWDTGSSWANTSERLKPYDFRGRPFIGLVDLNYVNLNAENIKYSSGYREIGLHYQITSDRLERGYRSHGCVRVRDKDLYQLDTIVNQGSKDMIKAVFKQDLPNYEGLNHPHTYNKSVAMVKYTDKNAAAYRSKQKSESILCKLNPKKSRNVRWNNADIKDYHTVIGNDCLTSTERETGITSADIKAFWNGRGSRIRPFLVNQEHGPVQRAKETLLSYNYQSAVINEMSQKQRLETIAGIQDGSIGSYGLNGLNDNTLNNNFNLEPVTRWPRLGLGNNLIGASESNRIGRAIQNRQNVRRRDRRRYYERAYIQYCVEPTSPTQYEKYCSTFQREALK